MKAIETKYKGCRFRSRLEARWAVFFDALGVVWEYEPEGYELGGGMRYLPDFWLPEFQMYVEIKPVRPDELSTTKAAKLRDGGKAVWLIWGPPRLDRPQDFSVLYCWNQTDGSVGSCDISCGNFVDAEEGLSLDISGRCNADYFVADNFTTLLRCAGPHNKIGSDCFDKTRVAVEAARGARFEFGESGARA